MLLHTIRDRWLKVRGSVSSVDDLMSPAGAGGTPKTNWAARDMTKGKEIPLAGNGIKISAMGNTENKTCTMNVWLYGKHGPAEWVGSFTITVGSREVVEDPTTDETSSLLYIDTIVAVDQEWEPDRIRLEDADGNEGFAILKIADAEGSDVIKVEVAAIDADTEITFIFKYH